MHALIIDQDAWAAFMIEEALLELGYTSFHFAASAQEAESCARARCPDLITSAVHLGSNCGIETVKSICSGREIPVVFVTATGWKVREANEGLTVVQKPFGIADLQQAVKQVVGGGAVNGAPMPPQQYS